MATNEKVIVFNEIFTVSSCIAVSYSCEVDISIDICSYELEKVSIATTTAVIARGAGWTGTITVTTN